LKILIIGAAGMIGRKLTEALVRSRAVGHRDISEIILADVVPAAVPQSDIAIRSLALDMTRPESAAQLLESRPDLIFHLAAVVSGEAEADFEKGYRVNLDGTRYLLEAIRNAGQGTHYRPRLVFASSIAVFGDPLPDVIPDEFPLTPLTSYGTQKAICELLLADYSRRGFVDGIAIRLPTIVVRPGLPNKAASGFFSGIIREPLAGVEAILPVSQEVRHWFASPRAAIGFLLHASSLDTSSLGQRRSLSMPGLSATVGEQIEALRRVAGDKAVALIRPQPDPAIAAMVGGWPRNFAASRALSLGFVAEKSFDEIIRVHIEDELQGEIA
jgi:nucleoside-diphosphate-sugar epimerase